MRFTTAACSAVKGRGSFAGAGAGAGFADDVEAEEVEGAARDRRPSAPAFPVPVPEPEAGADPLALPLAPALSPFPLVPLPLAPLLLSLSSSACASPFSAWIASAFAAHLVAAAVSPARSCLRARASALRDSSSDSVIPPFTSVVLPGREMIAGKFVSCHALARSLSAFLGPFGEF